MNILEINKDKPRILKSYTSMVDWEEFCPIGIYTCNEKGTVQSVINPMEIREAAPMVWVFSEEPSFFKFSTDTLKHPIVIRKGDHLWYCSFRNFKFVYNDICNGRNRYNEFKMEKYLFDPTLFSYKVKIYTHNTLYKTPDVLPWMFFRDKFKDAEIPEPRESARKALSASQPFYIGNFKEPVYFKLYYMGGRYYCQSITDVDPLISKENSIRGYVISDISDDKMTIRYKIYNGELIVVGGYHDPEEYEKKLNEIAERSFSNPSEREEFFKWVKKFKLNTNSIRRKYEDISQERVEEAANELREKYDKVINQRIQRFKLEKLI
jgi:hypothetical protein